MASAVNFRMHHGAENSQQSVNFVGNGIRVLDLKREILERKKFSPTTDFDLKIVDQSGKVYDVDDEYIPKNSSLVVRRMPTKSAATSLIARLKGNFRGGSVASNLPVKTDIVMPVKAEAEPLIVSAIATAPVHIEATALASSEMLTEEENDALNQISQRSTSQIGGNRTWVNDGASISASSSQGSSGLAGITRRQGGGVASSGGHGAGYVCRRCGKAGHFLPNCPTNGDPAYENKPAQNQKLMNTSQGSRKIVATLEGIETKNKTVNQLADGRWEIFESSQSGLMRLTRESESSTALNIDMKEVPEYLKCPISNTFLKEAVSLPCCRQCVNDSIVRQQLLTGGLKCPLCGADNISTDALTTRVDIRNSVDSYIRDKTKKAAAVAAAESASVIAAAAAAASAYIPIPVIKAPQSPAFHIPEASRLSIPPISSYEIPLIVPMRPPPPPGGPPPSSSGSGGNSGLGPGSLGPVGFAPPPPQPAQRPEMILGLGLPGGQGQGQQGVSDFHQVPLMGGPSRHMMPGMAMSGVGGPSGGGSGAFYPPGMMAPNMVMMMPGQGQGPGPGLGAASDMWAMQQAQNQTQKHMGGIGIPPMQHMGLMAFAEHQQGLPSIPDGWMWGPNGPIPPRDFFVAPMTREEFLREQNAQLEESRRREEKRSAMARERNEQRNQQGGRGSTGSRGGGRGSQEQGYGQDNRYSGGSSSRRNRDPSRSDEYRDTRDRGESKGRRENIVKVDLEKEAESDIHHRNRSSSRDSKIKRGSDQGSDISTVRKSKRRSRSMSNHNDSRDDVVEKHDNGDGDVERRREKEIEKEKETERNRERPRDAERERRDKDMKEKQKEKDRLTERNEREKERERQKEKERVREKEKEKEKEMKKLDREKGERADREKVREQQDRDRDREREKTRTKEVEREKEKTREVEREKDRTREVEREKDRAREIERVKDKTRETEREKDKTRETEREKDRMRDDEKERKARDGDRTNGHEDRNKDRGSAKGGSRASGSSRDVATDRKSSRSTNEALQSNVRDRDRDRDRERGNGREVERDAVPVPVRDIDRGPRSRANDEDSQPSTSTAFKKRDRDEPALYDRDREEKNGSKRSKTADVGGSTKGRGGDRDNSRDEGGSDPSQRQRPVVFEDQPKSDRNRTKDRNLDHSERSAPSQKSSRNGSKPQSQRDSADQSTQQLQQGNGGFYTSKFKARSVVADSGDSRKGKQRDDGEDRWEMRKI